jgi:glycosyltransferase involved in cell wall biosynthesis
VDRVRILYLLTAPPPPLEGTDAVAQEAETLRARFGGSVETIAVASRPWVRIPRALYGLQKPWSLRRLEREADLVHVYHAELFAFPVLRLLRKPVVYSVVAGLGDGHLPGLGFLRRLGAIVVPHQRDLSRLRQLGVSQGHVITGGIDKTRLTFRPAPRGETFVLMSGSPPWTAQQFRTKGVDALLEALRQTPFLRLVFLWRGWFLEELRRRIADRGLADRVEVLADKVDVNEVLGRVHAAVVLAEEPKLVKAFPHSLLEALAAGRPVIVSRGIALAEHVEHTGCGQVVRGVDQADLVKAIGHVKEGYSSFQANAVRVGQRDFSLEGLVESYRGVYASVLESGASERSVAAHASNPEA